MKQIFLASTAIFLAQGAWSQEADEVSPRQMLEELMQEGAPDAPVADADEDTLKTGDDAPEAEPESDAAPETGEAESTEAETETMDDEPMDADDADAEADVAGAETEAETMDETAAEAEPEAAPDVTETTSNAAEGEPADTQAEPEPAPLKDWTEAYDDSFIAYPFWSGEYPNGFETGAEPVTVKGRLVMSPASPRSVSCTLPAKANFHPWNGNRVSMDSLVFWTVTQPTRITVNEDFEGMALPVDTEYGDGNDTMAFSAGDEIIYKRYLAEGFFIGEFDGVEYEMSEPEMNEFVTFERAEYDDHEWIEVSCAEGFGRRAWLRYSEAVKTDGINPSTITGFGEASDPE